MKVPFRLKPRAEKSVIGAVLLTSHDTAELCRLFRRLKLDAPPTVHVVADGFLVVLPTPRMRVNFGVIALRELAKHLWLPADADLVPALLPEEAKALASRRGLVFLPGVRVLEYAMDTPLAASDLLRVAPRRRDGWLALPKPPTLADDVVEIALVLPPLDADDFLSPAADGENPSPSPDSPEASLPTKLAAKTLFGLGKGIAKLGSLMKAPGMAGFGAKLLGGAMSMLPKLASELMGDQEAALRRLLREFREGDEEKALKHAMPLGGESGGANAQAPGTSLPTHDLFYSLRQLLGESANRGGGGWFSTSNTYYELMNEYRKRAEKAARAGDFRRAAFIYAKLLRDFRAAAQVLSLGGLHRDAAQIYEKLANDWPAAAREWEAAGEIDRALLLHRRNSDHIGAADLLRRVGEEELALAEYQLAAQKCAETNGYYEAGMILVSRALRPDLALPYFEAGWKARPQGRFVACAVRLAEHHNERDTPPLIRLLDEADPALADWTPEGAATFYNRIAQLADAQPDPATADEMRDRSLIGLATQLRASRRWDSVSRNIAHTFFPGESTWSVPLQRDMHFAFGHTSIEKPNTPAILEINNLNQHVSAVWQAPKTGEIFIGSESGQVHGYHPETGGLFLIAQESGPITGIVSDADDETVFVLTHQPPMKVKLTAYSRATGFRESQHVVIDQVEFAFLANRVVNQTHGTLVVVTDRAILRYDCRNLALFYSVPLQVKSEWPIAAIQGSVRGENHRCYDWVRLFFPSGASTYDLSDSTRSDRAMTLQSMPWTATSPSEIWYPQLLLHAVQASDGDIACLGIVEQEKVGRVRFDSLGEHRRDRDSDIIPCNGCLAVAWLGPDLFALVTKQNIEICSSAGGMLSRIDHPLSEAIAAFYQPQGNALVVVDSKGKVVRLPL
jgi:tetratricopeptide (TPR) repeat protein